MTSGRRSWPCLRRPGFRRQRHADSKLSTQSNTSDGAVSEQIPIALREGAQAGKNSEEKDCPAQHLDAADIVAKHAKHDAADDRAEQRPGDERASLRCTQVQAGGDGTEDETKNK